MSMTEGLLVSLEGIDGSGKSSVWGALRQEFDGEFTYEPCSLPTGEWTQQVIESGWTPRLTDFHMFMADRAAHIQEVIQPALDAGKLVVVDRYLDSTRAYQEEALDGVVKMPRDYIEAALSPAVYREPDLTILLDIDTDTAATRASDGDKYEDSEFHAAVRRNYLELAASRDRIIKVDATQPEPAVHQLCSQIVAEACDQHFDERS